MRIWKYAMAHTEDQVILMPLGAKILTVQMQRGMIALWAMVDETFTRSFPNAQMEPRHIGIFGTGNPMPDNPGIYINTFQEADGMLIWHAFELPPQENR